MSDKPREPLSPTMEDLAYVQIKNSHLFGLTNLSGKALGIAGAISLGTGVTGLLQMGGIIGAVAGVTLSWPAVFIGAGGAIGLGGLAWWLGNFDDKAVDEHNSKISRAFRNARGAEYNHIGDALLKTLAAAEYDPDKKTLPHDAMGLAVRLDDEKLEKLPAHVQADIFRTQIDQDLYRHTGRTSAHIVEAREQIERIAGLTDMKERAQAYRNVRDYVYDQIEKGTLEVTFTDVASVKKSGGLGAVLAEVADAMTSPDNNYSTSSSGSGGWSWPRGSSSGGSSSGGFGGEGFRRGGGFGGEGFKTGGAIAAGGFQTGGGFGSDSNGAFQAFSGGGSGNRRSSNSGGSDFKMDGNAAQGLVLIAAVAAAVAAVVVTGFSLYKNFIDKAPKPDNFHGVKLPVMTRALASDEAEIRKMYAPKP